MRDETRSPLVTHSELSEVIAKVSKNKSSFEFGTLKLQATQGNGFVFQI